MPMIPWCSVHGHERVAFGSLVVAMAYAEHLLGRSRRADDQLPLVSECPDCHPELLPQRDLVGARRVEAAWLALLGLAPKPILQDPPWVPFEEIWSSQPGLKNPRAREHV